MNKQSRKTRVSAREVIITSKLESVRSKLIDMQLEKEFIGEFLKDNNLVKGSTIVDENIKIMNSSFEYLDVNIQIAISQLQFYKRKRNELKDKKMIEDCKQFPEKINMSQLVSVENEEIK